MEKMYSDFFFFLSDISCLCFCSIFRYVLEICNKLTENEWSLNATYQIFFFLHNEKFLLC